MTAVERILRNSLALIAGNLLVKILTLVFWAIVARRLGAEDFGIFAFAFATVGIIVSLCDFGISYVVVREGSRDRGRALDYLANGAMVKLLFAALGFGFLVVARPFIAPSEAKARLVLILALSLPASAMTMAVASVFNALEKMHLSALLDVISLSLYLILGGMLLWRGGGLMELGWAYVAATTAGLAVGVGLLKREISPLRFRLNCSVCKGILQRAVGFALSSVFVEIYFRISVVILAFMASDTDVGTFSAAYRLITALVFIPGAFMQALFPNLSQLSRQAPGALRQWGESALRWLALLALPMAIVTTLLAEPLILFIYGPEYLAAMNSLRILIWALAILFVNSVLIFVLYSADQQNFTGLTAVLKTIANVGLAVVLIPLWKEVGTSVAILVTELLGFAMHYVYVTRRVVRVHLVKCFLKPALASVIVGSVVAGFQDLNFFLSLVAAAVVLVSSLFVLRVFSEEEMDFLKAFLNGSLRRVVKRFAS